MTKPFELAACIPYGADVMFPETVEGIHRAQRICMDCPHQQDCLDMAYSNHEKDGVWGGHYFGERRAEQAQAQRRRAAERSRGRAT